MIWGTRYGTRTLLLEVDLANAEMTLSETSNDRKTGKLLLQIPMPMTGFYKLRDLVDFAKVVIAALYFMLRIQ